LFETIAVYRGRPLLLQQHLQRLLFGCEKLNFASTPSAELLRQEVLTISDGIDRGVVKLIVTRGSGPRGYRTVADQPPRVIVMLEPGIDYARCRQSGMHVGLCAMRLAPQPQLAGIKHLNRLEQVLARGQWGEEWDEGIVRDLDGFCISGTQSNLFVVIADTLITPPIETCGIAGIMRSLVIDIAAEQQLDLQIRPVSYADLSMASEAFMTNSLLGVGPARYLCERPLAPGFMARRLQEYLYEKVLVVPD